MDNDLTPEQIRKTMFHPENNPDAISLLKRPDGNWRGFMQKNGKLLQSRTGDPLSALQALITAD